MVVLLFGSSLMLLPLIRAVNLESIPLWIDPQQEPKPHRIAAGPGKLCRALKIDLALNETLLQPGQALWLEQRDSRCSSSS